MQSWSLRWKIALDAALIGVVATISGAGTTWIIMHYLELTKFGQYEADEIGRDILLGMVGAIPTVLIVAILGGRWVARKAVRPVDAIRQAAAGITLQNLDKRFPLPATGDEIAGLIDVLNTMLDRLQSSYEQSVRFSAEASHQLKTPLAVLRADVEAMLHAENPCAEAARAPEMLEQIHQLSSIAENLLLLARADSGRLELQKIAFDLRELLDGICDDARALAEAQHLTVEAKIPDELPIVGDRSSIALVLQNLIENAVKFNVPNGCICIYAETLDGHVQVRIKNNGSPIPPERIPHIFDRFSRAQSHNGVPGRGLGLSIASELIKAHSGSLDLIRSDSAWTEFRLRLPRKLIDAETR
jgi:signal transduction histidine kinase